MLLFHSRVTIDPAEGGRGYVIITNRYVAGAGNKE